MLSLTFSHIALSCQDPLKIERFYTKYFHFERARVYAPGPEQVVMIKSSNVYLELFPAKGDSPIDKVKGAGPEYPAWRHIAFLVENLATQLAAMGEDAQITLGPVDMSAFIPGMHVCWLQDPEGNIVEINQGYVDEESPLPLTDELLLA